MMLGNADIVMLTLIDRLALWCIGNPFESFRSNIIIPVDTFIVTVINDLQFKLHFFIVIMQASNKFHGIEISLLYNIIPFYRYLSSTTFGYIFFLIINNICWCNLQFHALTLHFVWVSRLSIKSVVRGTQRRLVVPLHPPSPPRHRPCYIHLCPASGMDDTHDLSGRCLIPLNLGAECGSVVLIALIVANTTECTRKAFYNHMSIKVHKNRLETKLMIKYAKW